MEGPCPPASISPSFAEKVRFEKRLMVRFFAGIFFCATFVCSSDLFSAESETFLASGLYEAKIISTRKSERLTSFLEVREGGDGELKWVDLDTVLTFRIRTRMNEGKGELTIEVPQSNGEPIAFPMIFSPVSNGFLSASGGPMISKPWFIRPVARPVWEKISVNSDYEIYLNQKGNAILIRIPDFSPEEFERAPGFNDVRYYAKKIFRLFRDDFDFILNAYNYPAIPRTWAVQGVSFQVYNEVKGIGMTSVMAAGSANDPSQYGSEGRLKRFIFLAKLSGVKNGPCLHEIMHSWGIFINTYVDSTSVGSDGPGHWGMAEVFGAMGGFKPGSFKDLGKGHYRADFAWVRTRNLGWNKSRSMNLVPYSDLELYLMGLAPIEEVKPFIYCTEGVWESHPALGTFTARKVETIDPAEIVQTYGAREPSWKESQKDFRGLAVLACTNLPSAADTLVFEEGLDYFSSKETPEEAPYNFYTATRGRATLRFDGLRDSILKK